MVAVDGAELFYTVRGRGPVCLVPSAIGTRPYELMMPAPLTERLRLVHVDLRGGGRSTGHAADLTFDVLAGDFEAIRADLGVDRVAVLGHSILGMLAFEYGRRCPERVSHVIAVGTPPQGDMREVAAAAAGFFEEDASDERKRILRENLGRWCAARCRAALAPTRGRLTVRSRTSVPGPGRPCDSGRCKQRTPRPPGPSDYGRGDHLQ